jgi:hypothetical protein
VEHVWHQSKENMDNAIASLLENYCLPCQSYHFCSICQKLVSDRYTHYSSRHYLACQETQSGCLIKEWENNSPKIVPLPITLDNQSLFCGLFQVEWARLVTENNAAAVPGSVSGIFTDSLATGNILVSNFSKILDTQTQRFESGIANPELYVVDQQAEPSPWLNRVGYDKVLGPFDMVELHSLALNVHDSDEQMQRISILVTNTLWNVVNYARAIDKNNPSLFHVNRISDTFPTRPFNPTLKINTWERYIGVVVKVCIIVLRLETAIFDKPKYELTDRQQTLIHQILSIIPLYVMLG